MNDACINIDSYSQSIQLFCTIRFHYVVKQMVMKQIFCLVLVVCFNIIAGNHFRGGMISWRPASNAASVIGTKRTIVVDQRYAWSRSAAASSCTSSTITSYGLIGDTTVTVLTCESLASTCSAVGYSTISTYVPCTDYNTVLGLSLIHI